MKRAWMWPAWRKAGENRYSALLADALIECGVDVRELRGSAWRVGYGDVVHVHWPDVTLVRRSRVDAFARSRVVLSFLRYARWRGAKIVWTAHNVREHELRHEALSREFWTRFAYLVDGVIYLEEETIEPVLEAHPGLRRARFAVIPHGDYRAISVGAPDRVTARHSLGIPQDAVVLAFVGLIRPYKNVDHLVEVFAEQRDPKWRLVLAGRIVDRELAVTLQAAVSRDERVVLIPRVVSEREIREIMSAADVAVLPFAPPLNSGSALLALSFSRPVIVGETTVTRRLAEQAGAGWVHLLPGGLTVSEMRGAVEAARRPSSRPAHPDLGAYDWGSIGVSTAAFYGELGGPGGG